VPKSQEAVEKVVDKAPFRAGESFYGEAVIFLFSSSQLLPFSTTP
jgi:hypothetical protein